MSKQIHKPKKINKLDPSEDKISKRILLGKEQVYKLNTLEELDKPISELKSCGQSTIRKLFTSKD